MGEGVGLDRECMEFVTAGFLLFFSFFLEGGRGPGALCFSKQYFQLFSWCF